MKSGSLVLAVLLLGLLSRSAHAQLDAPPVTTDQFSGGKLLGTAGVSQLEGAGGGGLTPWALITGYGTNTQVGANGHVTHIANSGFHINSYGAALGLYDRVEFSVARQDFDTDKIGIALGLGKGFTIRQDVLGVKLKVAGDAVLEQDSLLPQISVGAQYKHNNRPALIATLWAGKNDGVDLYVSATKLILSQSLLLNGTLRLTKANQTGFLGFTGDYKPMAEGSAALLLSRHWAIGAEYRMKPNNIPLVAKENDWADVFVAWFPNKNVSVTAAYLKLGNVVTRDNQEGLLVSLQVGF
jgi:Protein of unknown function (DUF3034)